MRGSRRVRARDVTAPPPGLTIVAVAAVALVALPVTALVWRAPWSRMVTLVTSGTVTTALGLSMVTATAAAVVAVVVGAPAAYVVARSRGRWVGPVRTLVTLPLVLPPVVGGAALLFAFGRRGLLGAPLEAAGITLPFSTAGVVLAQVFVSLPFVVLSVDGAVRSLDPAPEQVAATLGAGRWRRLWWVTVPRLLPAVGTAAVLAWARALGEFGATVTFAGNLPGRTQTLPLAVFVALESDRDAAVAMSLVLVAVSVGVLTALRARWWPR